MSLQKTSGAATSRHIHQGRQELSEEDIKKMMDAAKQFESDDKKKREEIELRNQLILRSLPQKRCSKRAGKSSKLQIRPALKKVLQQSEKLLNQTIR